MGEPVGHPGRPLRYGREHLGQQLGGDVHGGLPQAAGPQVPRQGILYFVLRLHGPVTAIVRGHVLER